MQVRLLSGLPVFNVFGGVCRRSSKPKKANWTHAGSNPVSPAIESVSCFDMKWIGQSKMF